MIASTVSTWHSDHFYHNWIECIIGGSAYLPLSPGLAIPFQSRLTMITHLAFPLLDCGLLDSQEFYLVSSQYPKLHMK